MTQPPTLMRRFELHRDEDVSGVSGTGRVAEGVQLSNGFCALNWLSPYHTTAFYSSADDLEHIHSRGGRTRLVWLDPPVEGPQLAIVAARLAMSRKPPSAVTVSARVLINSGTIAGVVRHDDSEPAPLEPTAEREADTTGISMLSENYTIELPQFVRDGLGIAPGEYVYFVQRGDGGYHLFSEAMMDAALGSPPPRAVPAEEPT